jgi:hypothetical protein
MEPKSSHRKLTAILSAGVVVYCQLYRVIDRMKI